MKLILRVLAILFISLFSQGILMAKPFTNIVVDQNSTQLFPQYSSIYSLSSSLNLGADLRGLRLSSCENLIETYLPIVGRPRRSSRLADFGLHISYPIAPQDTLPQITGKVVDAESGEPLIGVNILIPGTSTGTVTDYDGTYNLVLGQKNSTLEFSYTGYFTQEILVDTLSNNQTIGLQVDLSKVLETSAISCFFPPAIIAANKPNVQQLSQLHLPHPNLLLRGQLPGLIVSQAGNDPWGVPVMRHQGIHTLSQNASPLWVVDGMPEVDPLLFSTQSVKKIEVARRPVDMVQFGMQAGAGTINQTTKQYAYDQLEINYQGQVSYERPINLPQVADAEAFRLDPGGVADIGFSTNWLDEITRDAWSTQHQLSIGSRKDNSIWRTEGSYQNVQGAGQNSAWQQYNGRFFWQKDAWKDRLQLSLQAAGYKRWGTMDYPTTFFFATKFNPTAPIRFDGPPSYQLIEPLYETSSLLLRNFFEIAPSLDYFNPVAIQNTSALFQQNASRLVQAKVKWQILDQLNWQVAAAYQANDREWGEENRTYALFRGNALTTMPGAAQRREFQNRQEWLNTSLNFDKKIPNGRWKMLAAYQFQRFNQEERFSSTQGFSNDDFTYRNFEAFLSPQSVLFQDIQGETHRLIGFQFKNELDWKLLKWRTTYLHQGSTLLGTNKRWMPQFGSDLELDLNALFQQHGDINTTLHLGYAQLGNLPINKSFAQGQPSENPGIFFNDNPDLSAEVRQLGQMGISWERYNWFVGIDYYGSRTNDPIVSILRDDLPGPFNIFGVNLNQIALRNRSWEFNAGIRVHYGVEWNSRLSWAFTRTNIVDTGEDGPVGFFDINDQHPTNASGALGFNWPLGVGLIEIDAPFGQMIGLQFDRAGSLASGIPTHNANFVGDGLPNPDPSFGIIGNALPKHTFAWHNSLAWNNWQLEWLIRGELGHDLANLRRAELDPLIDNDIFFLTAQNYMPTAFDLPGVKGLPVFSDRYVESGNYLSLDYVSISHRFYLGKDCNLNVYLSGQNLWLLTAYTGVDPSPRFVDEGPERNGTLPNLSSDVGQLAPGIDRRYFYPRTQTFTLGVRLTI